MDENIDWSLPFNELTYGSDPVNTQEFCDSIERFCCYHYDKVSEFHINLKERGVWEDATIWQLSQWAKVFYDKFLFQAVV